MFAGGCPGRALELSSTNLEEPKEAQKIFTALVAGELTPIASASLAAEKARQLGREGMAGLCEDLASLAHDTRRSLCGGEPLERDTLPDIADADDSMLEALVDHMRICGNRIKANVSPAMAMASALAAVAEKVRKQ